MEVASATHNVEFYAMMQALQHWKLYLQQCDIVLYINHEASSLFNGNHHFNHWHGRWAAFLQQFNLVINHKPGMMNSLADAVSHQRIPISILYRSSGLWPVKRHLQGRLDFEAIWSSFEHRGTLDFSLTDGFFFFGTWLLHPKLFHERRSSKNYNLEGWEVILDRIKPWPS